MGLANHRRDRTGGHHRVRHLSPKTEQELGMSRRPSAAEAVAEEVEAAVGVVEAEVVAVWVDEEAEVWVDEEVEVWAVEVVAWW